MLIDESISRLINDNYNLMIDENFIKFYYNVNKQRFYEVDKLMFLEDSAFEMKLNFIINKSYLTDDRIVEGLKRSPWMCKKNISSLYK